MPTASLTSKGQTTVPKPIREFLNLKAGDKMDFQINEKEKTVTLRPANIPLAQLRGLLKSKGMKPFNPDERSTAIKARANRNR